MPKPTQPYQPYAAEHENRNGPGDARPTALKVLQDCNKLGALKGKTVLITGCSSGIGVETGRALYLAGATVFMAARDLAKQERVIEEIVTGTEEQHKQSRGPRPQALELHLDTLAGVRRAAAEFRGRSEGRLNVLINNAGVMMAPFARTADGFELQIGTNHFGHLLLFHELKALLLASASPGSCSRVICLSSAGHRRCAPQFTTRAELDAWNRGEKYDKFIAYGQSKTANIWMANSIDRHYADRGVVGLSVHPGGIMTELSRHLSEEDMAVLGDFNKMRHIFKNPMQGAATTVWAAVSDHFEGKNGGTYLADVGESGPFPPTYELGSAGYQEWAYDEAGEENLWKLSAEAVGVSADDQ